MPSPADRTAAQATIAYLSDGKLYLKRPGVPATLVESQFAQQMVDRAQRGKQRNEWKTRNAAGSFLGGGMLWGKASPQSDGTRRVRITGVSPGAVAGELIYALDTDSVGGLFCYDTAADHERRLFHRNEFRARDLARHSKDQRIALSVAPEDGSAGIGVMELTGRGVREVTEGDAVDEAPAWVPGDGNQLVFQSAGIGRDATGRLVALSPYAIQKLDLDGEKVTTLLESETIDYLLPPMAADGSLYFIRRPYKSTGHAAVSPLKVALDILLFPFRVVRALVHFLDFFSVMFSKKPILTAGGPKQEGPEKRHLLLYGMWIDTEKAMREGKKDGASLVPKTWELVRRRENGEEEVLGKGVLSFDLCSDGSVVYTNGLNIYQQSAGNGWTEVCSDKLIERVTVVG